MSRANRSELRDLIEVRRGKFVLHSGAESTLFVDCLPAMLSPRGSYLVCHNLLHTHPGYPSDGLAIVAIELGLAPVLSSLVQALCAQTGLVLRKDGTLAGDLTGVTSYWIVDDVLTTGASIHQARAALPPGAPVLVSVLVDRSGLSFVPAVFTLEDLL